MKKVWGILGILVFCTVFTGTLEVMAANHGNSNNSNQYGVIRHEDPNPGRY